MSTAIPAVPPRPSRGSHGQATESSNNSPVISKIPNIPPRPARRIERSTSPQRFARSPLNEAPIHLMQGSLGKSSLYSTESATNSDADLTRTTSNVETLPSVGQEGHEYADVFNGDDASSSPKEARVVGDNVQLHAPKPSLPTTTAKQRVAAVTRTDSDQAAAHGIGKGDSQGPSGIAQALKSKASFASQMSNMGNDTMPASYDGEHGMAGMGQRVPMYPNAGDVQAPSPTPGSSPFASGIGFHNDGSRSSLHGRKASQVNFDLPADAYGKHGHGMAPHDRFERAYYEKHPELIKKELDQYHEKAEWAMSSDDLNDLVRGTASRGAGFGTSGEVGSIPPEQVGFKATEEYASRMSSPMVKPTEPDDTPALGAANKAKFESALSRGLQAEKAGQSQETDNSVIHVDPSSEYRNKIYGGDIAPGSTNSLGVQQDIPTDQEEVREQFAYSAPILAEDEVAKTPMGSFMQPAVSPMPDHPFESPSEGFYNHRTGSGTSLSGSRPSSRPGSMQPNDSHHLLGGGSHLEDLEEYEPLFPEDENDDKAAKPVQIADRRSSVKNKRFPGQDIWEDTPNSLQYTATVSTPDLPSQMPTTKLDHSEADGAAAVAFAKKQEEAAEAESTTPDSFLGPAKKAWTGDVDASHDAHAQHGRRFPSRDIWEDTPDSLQLETTVDTPQNEEKQLQAPSDESSPTKPNAPVHPQIPERSATHTSSGASSSPPNASKLKPQIPARPARAKPQSKDATEGAPLAQTTTTTSTGSASATSSKPKPPVPSRPVGGKIAALQGGFMADLNKRLQLGPQAAMKAAEEDAETQEDRSTSETTEKGPLPDARKGRARGPQRRAPAVGRSTESSAASADRSSEKSKLGLGKVNTVFEVDPSQSEGSILVSGDGPAIERDAFRGDTAPSLAKSGSDRLTQNMAGEDVHAEQGTAGVGLAALAKEDPVTEIDNNDHSEKREAGDEAVVATGPNMVAKEDTADSVEENVPGGFKDV